MPTKTLSSSQKSALLLACIAAPPLSMTVAILLAPELRQIYRVMHQPPGALPWAMMLVGWGLMCLFTAAASYQAFSTKAEKSVYRAALFSYAGQIVVAVVWAVAIFRLNAFWYAVTLIVALDVLVIHCLYSFAQINVTAAKWMIPYFIWLLYFTYLTVQWALLNGNLVLL